MPARSPDSQRRYDLTKESPTGMADVRPRVSIIVVTWNALPLLKQCFPSVAATDYENLEIILADNASDDGSIEWIRRHFPNIRVLRYTENQMFCRGNNEAIPHATGKYVLLLNNDVAVPPGWLNPLVDELETCEDIAAVQPKVLQYEDRSMFEYAGASGGFMDRLGYPFARGRIFFRLEKDCGQYDEPRDIFWGTGAALLLRRSALDKVGLLDERFEMHMEEIDLCWRFQRAGYRIRVQPASEVYHIGGGSLRRGNPRKVYLTFRNNLLMLYKNLPEPEWKRVFAARCALDAAAAARALVSGHPTEYTAIMRAYTDAHRMKNSWNCGTIRPETLSETVLPSYRNSIVIDYFLRGRRRFDVLPKKAFV